MKHRADRYVMQDGERITGTLIPLQDDVEKIFQKYYPRVPVPPDPIEVPPGEQPAKPQYVFCRMFRKGTPPDAAALVELGRAMETEQTGDVTPAGDSNIPAGYTYLGQFIAHDITSDPTPLMERGMVPPERIVNQRTPALDLDCLYGDGPSQTSELFESDGVHLKVGKTSAVKDGERDGPLAGDFPNDLPRRADKKAIIGDERNDENLAVAQTHLAFIKFHNKKVDEIAVGNRALSGTNLLAAARKEVVLHYQSLILHDFLPRIVQKDVLKAVRVHGRKFYTTKLRDCMPIEFSVAAYRLGHSMVRPVYEWNKMFNTSRIPASLPLLFTFSEGSGPASAGAEPFFGKPTLPSNWIIDWTRFYDFSDVAGGENHPTRNFSRKIDTNLSFALNTLPEFQRQGAPPVFASLATRTLLRGRLVGLPTGQEVAQTLLDAGIDFEPISPAQIAEGSHAEVLRRHGFDRNTPLWYYILKEAKVKNGGNKLGPVGSLIVAEVFVGLIEHSSTSVLKERPALKFSMPQLLAFVGDLNPLGN